MPTDTYLGGDMERVGELHLLKAVAAATATLSCLGSAFLITTIHLMQVWPRRVSRVARARDPPRSASSKACRRATLARVLHPASLSRMQARPLGLRIVYWLSVADLGASLIFVIDGASPVYELQEAHCPNFYCTLKAFFAQLFGLAAIMWSPCIALTLHLQLKVPRVVREYAAATARRRAL